MVHGCDDDHSVACAAASVGSSSDSVIRGCLRRQRPCGSRTLRVSFSDRRPEKHSYFHLTLEVNGEPAYWSWARSEGPRVASQTQRGANRPAVRPVDVSSTQAKGVMQQKSILAHAAAIQNGVWLASGEGLSFDYDERNDRLLEIDRYEGSPMPTDPVARANDNRRRPLVWSRRHCRIYADPHYGSFIRFVLTIISKYSH